MKQTLKLIVLLMTVSLASCSKEETFDPKPTFAFAFAGDWGWDFHEYTNGELYCEGYYSIRTNRPGVQDSIRSNDVFSHMVVKVISSDVIEVYQSGQHHATLKFSWIDADKCLVVTTYGQYSAWEASGDTLVKTVIPYEL